MSIWKSIKKLFRIGDAKLASVVDNMENPAETFQLAVQESEERIKKIQIALTKLSAEQKLKAKQAEQFALAAENFKQQAQGALIRAKSESDEDKQIQYKNLAAEALKKKAIEDSKAMEFSLVAQKLDEQVKQQTKLMEAQKLEHDRLVAKKHIYAAKYENAKAQMDMAKAVSGLDDSALADVSKLTEKIDRLEAEAEAAGELSGATNKLQLQMNDLQYEASVANDLEDLEVQIEIEQNNKKRLLEEKKMKALEASFPKPKETKTLRIESKETKPINNEFFNTTIMKDKPKKDIADEFFGSNK